MASRGDAGILAAYCELEQEEIDNFEPRLIFVDAANKIVTLDEARESERDCAREHAYG